MSFNVKSYLADIDAEIAHHRETMRDIRAKLTELEDMRLLLMRREEYRSAVNGRPSPFGALHGAEIAVREMEAGVLSQAVKSGLALPSPGGLTQAEKKAEYQRRKREEKLRLAGITPAEGLNSSGNRRGMVQPPHKQAAKGGGHGRYKPTIIALLKSSKGVFNVDAIIDKLGEGPKHGKARQGIYQALYELRRDGIIESPHGIGTYAYKGITPTEETPSPQ